MQKIRKLRFLTQHYHCPATWASTRYGCKFYIVRELAGVYSSSPKSPISKRSGSAIISNSPYPNVAVTVFVNNKEINATHKCD